MKQCSKCRKTKSFDQFVTSPSKHDGLSCYCLECKAMQVREYYSSHPKYREQTKERAKRKREDNKIRVYQYLLSHPCVDCGEDDVIVLDFDHRDESKKTHNISALSRKAVKWETIKSEMEKCDVRCSNCHRRRTAKQFGGYAMLEKAKLLL